MQKGQIMLWLKLRYEVYRVHRYHDLTSTDEEAIWVIFLYYGMEPYDSENNRL